MLSKQEFEKMKKERMACEYHNTYGTPFKIIEYNSAKDVTIMFLDEYKVIKKVTYRQCEKGCVKNPYDKKIEGIGCHGIIRETGEEPTEKTYPREYKVWKAMFVRCYNKKYQEKEPSYKLCSVCERWHNFSNFLEDLPKIKNYKLWENNPNSGVSLDKDSIIKDNKIYSLETCCFLLREDNVAEGNRRTKSIPIRAKNIVTGEEIIFSKKKEMCDFFNIKNYNVINKCLRKEKASYRGFTFEYIEV